MPRSRLATLLSLAILSCSALIFVAALAYQYQTSREAILLETARNAKNLTLATAHKIEVILKGVEKIPLTLATCLETTPPHQGPLINLIRRSLARNPDIFGIAVAFEP